MPPRSAFGDRGSCFRSAGSRAGSIPQNAGVEEEEVYFLLPGGSESPSQFVPYITNMTSLRVTDEWLSLVCQAAFICQLLGIRKEGTLVRSLTRQNVGDWAGGRPIVG